MNCLGSAGYFALDFKHFGPLEAAMGRSNMDQGHSIGKGEGTLPLSPACAPLLLQVKMSLAATTDQTSPCLNRAGLGWETMKEDQDYYADLHRGLPAQGWKILGEWGETEEGKVWRGTSPGEQWPSPGEQLCVTWQSGVISGDLQPPTGGW